MKTKSVLKFWSFIFCIAAFLTAGALSFHLDKNIFAVEVVDVTWTPQAREFCLEQKLLCEYLHAELNEKLKIEIDKKIWQVDIASLRLRLLQNNWFKMIAISRHYSGKLNLIIDIEIPVALIANNSEIFAVGSDGQLLSPVKISLLPSLPILKGENLFREKSLRKLSADFLQEISDNLELSPKMIAEMTYSRDENFNLIILPSKSVVKMSGDHVALKAARVAQVIEYLNSNQMNGRVIDARFSKKVLVRLRKGS